VTSILEGSDIRPLLLFQGNCGAEKLVLACARPSNNQKVNLMATDTTTAERSLFREVHFRGAPTRGDRLRPTMRPSPRQRLLKPLDCGIETCQGSFGNRDPTACEGQRPL
jgi:hypothetical protein